MGRSFVQPKYWGTRALDYLWYGIGAYLRQNPHVKYMFGPVSISASFPKVAKDMLIFYYSHYFLGEDIIEARIPYQYSSNIQDLRDIFYMNDRKKDFKILKSSLNAMGVAVPTLFKQYAEICEEGGVEFLGFNIDPDFSDCVDGFILVKIDKLKENQRKRYIG